MSCFCGTAQVVNLQSVSPLKILASKNKLKIFLQKFFTFNPTALPLRQKAARNKGAAETQTMYSVNYFTKQVIQGSDFFTKQAAQNALADHIRLNTTYGIDVENVEVVRGGGYESFLAAREALITALHLDLKHEPVNEEAYDRYRRGWDVKNPNESRPFESLGFAPHQPLTALNL